MNGDDKEFMNLFWKVNSITADGMGKLRKLNILKKGLLNQVAAYKVIEALGKKPKLSHPNEDAFNAIDLWTEKKRPFRLRVGVKKYRVLLKQKILFSRLP